MQEKVISFETAKLAKEKGFDVEIKYYYDFKKFGEKSVEFFGKLNANRLTKWDEELRENIHAEYISAPTQSLLQKWLREVHKLHINPAYDHIRNNGTYLLWFFDENKKYSDVWDNQYQTYEKALEIGLQEGLRLV